MVIEIRTEQPEGRAAVQEVHLRAFGGPAEAKLVRLISERNKALIALVGLSDDMVVGHILFSQVTVAYPFRQACVTARIALTFSVTDAVGSDILQDHEASVCTRARYCANARRLHDGAKFR